MGIKIHFFYEQSYFVSYVLNLFQNTYLLATQISIEIKRLLNIKTMLGKPQRKVKEKMEL